MTTAEKMGTRYPDDPVGDYETTEGRLIGVLAGLSRLYTAYLT